MTKHKYKKITEQEVELVRLAKDKDHLVQAYFDVFKTLPTPYRLTKLWDMKKGMQSVKIPAAITSPIASKKSDTPDVGEILVKIHQEMAMMVQLQKEQLDLFRFLKKNSDKEEKNDTVVNP